jgi:stonin-1/2
MANPFLFMEDENSVAGATNDAFANPFLVEDDDDEGVEYPSENPFSASNPFAFNDADDDGNVAATTASELFPSDTVTQAGANLFLVEDDVDEQQVDATMSFFGTTINEHDGLQYQKPNDLNVHNHDDPIIAYSSEDEFKSKKPPRPNPPPSQMTQQMITNLTDHLDQTSTNLLGKIPVTRSPSPVSMRDLHSPSPTPDVGDLLDVSEAFSAAQQAENISNNHETEHKPNRPPPPRPIPPRPTPPKVSPVTASTPVYPINTATVTQASHHNEDDLLNFDGQQPQKKPPPKPPAPKSKEDILSLFATPAQPLQQVKKPDLMSEDIDFTQQNQTQTPVAVVQPYEPKNEKINETPVSIPQAIVEPMVHQPVENHVIKSQSIPKIEMDLTPDLPEEIDDHPTITEDIVQPKSEVSSDHSPESGITSSGIPASASGSMLNMALQEAISTPTIQEPMQEEPNPFSEKVLTPPEQVQQLQFLQQKSTEYQYQRPTTPDPIVAQPELAPIFGGPIAPTSPAKPAPPRPPARGGSVLTTTQTQPTAAVVPEIFKSDEFDDFSAKFESKSQPKITGNAFLDSLGQSEPASTVDAWGDSDAFSGPAVAVDDGFGNDEDGFDTWDPPVVPESTPYMARKMSGGSEDGKDFSVVIKPKGADIGYANAPILGPPPPQRSPYSGSAYSEGI